MRECNLPRTYMCICKREHVVPMYAVAQTAAGHTVTHTCDCGRVTTVTSKKLSIEVKPSKEPK